MSKQVYYEEQRLETLLESELNDFMGAPSLSPSVHNDVHGLGSAPRTDMTMPAGVYATHLDVNYEDPYPDGMMGRVGKQDFEAVSKVKLLAIALAAYFLWLPLA